MSQNRFSLVLLVLLGVTVVAVVARSCDGAHRDGFVVFEGLDATDLEHAAFTVERPARVALAATGSFETEQDTAMAATAWVVRRTDGRVVWRLGPHNAERQRATLAVADREELKLEPGLYDVYFASYGADRHNRPESSFLGGLLRLKSKALWRSDASRWALTLDVLDGEVEYADTDPEAFWSAEREGTLWATGPLDDDQREEFTFTASAPVALAIRALGEFEDGEEMDYGWIESLTTGQRVWVMTPRNTRPAGGAARNRAFDGEVRLTPGAYRAVFVTDARHDVDDWVENPPYQPYRWGMTLRADPPTAVQRFDPWADRQPLVALLGVRDDALERVTFTLPRRTPVWVSGTGELRSGHRYDYAWLQREGGATVWEMDYDDSRPAGGEARNRTVEAALTLSPGTYTLHYRSDDTHSAARWYSDAPRHPERWGVALFGLDAGATATDIAYQGGRTPSAVPDAPAPPPPMPVATPTPSTTTALPIAVQGLGNGRNEVRVFELAEPTRLRVRAVGELIRDDRYDYGWITREPTGEVVWQMTRENTEHAGGAAKNRRFDGRVELPAGRYAVRFRTDDSHSFARFEQEPPRDPAAWGIAVWEE